MTKAEMKPLNQIEVGRVAQPPLMTMGLPADRQWPAPTRRSHVHLSAGLCAAGRVSSDYLISWQT